MLAAGILGSPAAAVPYGTELLAQARRQRLWEDPYWLRLLHMRRTLSGALKSETKRPDFFLAAGGRLDPQAELEADLLGFFEPQPADPELQHAQCRFPERYLWLKTRLGADPSRLPDASCPRFEHWRDAISPRGVSIVFASGYLNNPSTLFGHTLLKMRRSTEPAGEGVLDYTLNFAAYTDETNGVLFAVKGLAGLYPGRFASIPYYIKIQEYNNIENRDLWEYPLTLDQAQTDRVLRHAWELGGAEFPYYFFTRNCSYQLLPLMDLADPSWDTSGALHGLVEPIDTVRLLLRRMPDAPPPLWRPSRWSQVVWRRSLLTPAERALAREAVRGDLARALEAARSLPPERRAAALDAASVYADYLFHAGKLSEEASGTRTHALQLERASIPVGTSRHPEAPSPVEPARGHQTHRLTASFGAGHGAFTEVSGRPALQDLLDDPAGTLPDSRLEMGHVRLRLYNDGPKGSLEAFDLFHVTALNPYDDWRLKPSWEIATGLEQARELRHAPRDALYYRARGGMGLSAALDGMGRWVFYGLALPDAGVGGVLDRGFRLGGGAAAGLVTSFGARWRLACEVRRIEYALGDSTPESTLKFEQSYAFTRDLALRMTLSRRGSYGEAMLSLAGFVFPW